MNHKLWYKKPASDWFEGLPIGTGRLAGMVMGSVKRERVGLNHEFLWKGTNRFRDNEKRSHLLKNVRKLLLEGKYEEGAKAGNDAFGGNGVLNGKPYRIDPYQPAGDLYFEIDHGFIYDYCRTLDLENGIVNVTYNTGFECKKFIRQYIAHLIEDRIIVRVYADGQPFNCAVWLDRILDIDCELSFNSQMDLLTMNGHFKDGIDFCTKANIWHKDGNKFVSQNNKIVINNTTEIIISVNIGTSANNEIPEKEFGNKWTSTTDWQELLNSHTNEYKKHYGNFELTLPFDDLDIPTNERLNKLRNGDNDPGLLLLYFNYSRYLLCASSANGKLPANLQGKWNEDINPAWESDYHHDINLEINYWCAEPVGMQKYTESLFQYLERFVPHAKKAASDLYGCKGVWFPLTADPWGRSTPEAYGWAVWVGAGAWLSQHIWWHYEYGKDKEFLRNRAYPFIKEVAEFYETYLIEDKNGVLQIVPSQSPENRFEGSGNFVPVSLCVSSIPVSLCVSSTMDIQLAYDVLSHAIKGSEILDIDFEKRQVWKNMLSKLPEMKIGSQGQLLEWNQEFKEVEPGHRHMAHLFGLFPGEQITPDNTPELFQAAMKSLKIRLANANGYPGGWCQAWTACCFARAGDGDSAFEHLNHLITDFSTDTLLDLYQPRIFQIDGNLGSVAAVIEMLLQSYHEEIDFLPALPSTWKEGKVRGIRARGGYTINIEWNNLKITRAEILPVCDCDCTVKIRKHKFSVSDSSGNIISVKYNKNCIVFSVKKGQRYILVPE